MRFIFLMFAPFLAFPGFAQTEFQTSLDADMTLILAGSDETDLGPETRNTLAEVSLRPRAEYLLQNGVEISGNLTFRAQTDHPARPGFAGAIVDCPAINPNCPSLAGHAVRGGFSRLSSIGAADETGPRGSLEAAFMAVDGGWGELVIGKDQGVGQRFYEGGPMVFELARNSDPALDPFGTSISRTRNDISSNAAKISYVTPRILGVRAGVSYAPDASARGLELDTKTIRTGVLEPDLDESIELGLQASRHLREADLRLRGSLTWSNAQVSGPYYDDVETVSAGLDVERRDTFRFGLSYLNSTNGGMGDYQSYAAGASVFVRDWEFRAATDVSKDDLVNIEGWSATIGLARNLTEHVGLTLGYRLSETDYFDVGTTQNETLKKNGVLLEVRIRK